MNLLQFTANFILITLLGLLIAFSPMIIAVNLLVVLKSSRPVIRTVVLMAGMALPLLIVAALAILVIKPDGTIRLGDIASKVKLPPFIDIAFGVWLIIVAIRRWRHISIHEQPKHPTNFIMQHPPDKLCGLFGFAFVKSTLSVTNIFAILVVSQLIITNAFTQPVALFLVLWVITIGLAPLGIILCLYLFRHETLEHLNVRVDNFLNRDLNFAITIILFALGTFFIVTGVFNKLRG